MIVQAGELNMNQLAAAHASSLLMPKRGLGNEAAHCHQGSNMGSRLRRIGCPSRASQQEGAAGNHGRTLRVCRPHKGKQHQQQQRQIIVAEGGHACVHQMTSARWWTRRR